jgi:hypothetical protein
MFTISDRYFSPTDFENIMLIADLYRVRKLGREMYSLCTLRISNMKKGEVISTVGGKDKRE